MERFGNFMVMSSTCRLTGCEENSDEKQVILERPV